MLITTFIAKKSTKQAIPQTGIGAKSGGVVK